MHTIPLVLSWMSASVDKLKFMLLSENPPPFRRTTGCAACKQRDKTWSVLLSDSHKTLMNQTWRKESFHTLSGKKKKCESDEAAVNS